MTEDARTRAEQFVAWLDSIRHATSREEAWFLTCDDQPKQAQEAIRELLAQQEADQQRIAALEQELRDWRTWGIVEVAVRNPNVCGYMEHWEGRALKAEQERDAFRAALTETLDALENIYLYESALDSEEAEWVKPVKAVMRKTKKLLGSGSRPTPDKEQG